MAGICEPQDNVQYYSARFFIHPTEEHYNRNYKKWLVNDVLGTLIGRLKSKFAADIDERAFIQRHYDSGWNDGGLNEQWYMGMNMEFTLRKYDIPNVRGVEILVPKDADEKAKAGKALLTARLLSRALKHVLSTYFPEHIYDIRKNFDNEDTLDDLIFPDSTK